MVLWPIERESPWEWLRSRGLPEAWQTPSPRLPRICIPNTYFVPHYISRALLEQCLALNRTWYEVPGHVLLCMVLGRDVCPRDSGFI